MKKEVILKATKMLQDIESLDKIIESLSGVVTLSFENSKQHCLMSIDLSKTGCIGTYFKDNPSLPADLDLILQETGQRSLALLKIRLQAEKKRIEASLESFSEDGYYRDQLFTKTTEEQK